MATPWKTRGLTPAGDVPAEVAKVCRTKYQEMLSYLKACKAGDDDAIHDMRVSSRRLATLLDVFRRCFPGDDYEYHRDALSALAEALGKVRDCDVFIGLLKDDAKALAVEENGAVHFLIDKRKKLRAKRHRKLIGHLISIKGRKYRRHFNDYVNRAGSAPFGQEKNSGPNLRDSGMVLIPKLYRNMMTQVNRSLKNPADLERLHAARLAGKDLRYTMEVYAQILPAEFDLCLAEIRELLETMGQIHDCDIVASIAAKYAKKWTKRGRRSGRKKFLSDVVLKKILGRRQQIRKGLVTRMAEILKKWSDGNFAERLVRTMG